MSSLLEQIAQKDGEIAELQNQLPALIESERAWRADSNTPCKGTKNQKAACAAENARKLGIANTRANQIKGINDQIKNLQATKASLQANLDAQNASAVELAKGGQSYEALVIEANGKAQADQQAAMIEAQANAAAITAKQLSDNEASKQNNQMIMIVIGVIILFALVFGAIKLKKALKNG